MGQADNVAAKQKSQVNYREGANNKQKYSPAVPGLEWSQNQAWCQTFQSWSFQEAGVKSLAPVTASCLTATNWYKNKKRFSYYPAVGAMVFFGASGGSHVGFVWKYDANYIYTYEGNTNDNGSAEGNGVYSKKRARRDTYLYGYGLPAYKEGIVVADPALKGKSGYTYKTAASVGAGTTKPTPPVEQDLPWVSSVQVIWAATNTIDQEKLAKDGDSNPGPDVNLVRSALTFLLSETSKDPSGIYGNDTIRLFNKFRSNVLHYNAKDATGAPGTTSLAELGKRSKKFNVRAGATPTVVLPWVSSNQVIWAATHDMADEKAVPKGDANPAADVAIVQDALKKVMGKATTDPRGIYGTDTIKLYNAFRKKAGYTGNDAEGAPGGESLGKLADASDMFKVRGGAEVPAPKKATPAKPATPAVKTGVDKISAKDVTYKRYTGTSNSANIDKWVREACKAAGVTPSDAWVKGYKTIISRESSGNCNACNVWDTNAITPSGYSKVKDYGDGYSKTGIKKLNGALTHFQCSRGIVQCIPQTFAAYHAAGTSVNIYDPVASIAASINYVMSRYSVKKDGSNLAAKVQQADPSRAPKGY